MKLRKAYRIAAENYYIALYGGQDAETIEGWEYELVRLHHKMVECGQEEAAEKIQEKAYWNM